MQTIGTQNNEGYKEYLVRRTIQQNSLRVGVTNQPEVFQGQNMTLYLNKKINQERKKLGIKGKNDVQQLIQNIAIKCNQDLGLGTQCEHKIQSRLNQQQNLQFMDKNQQQLEDEVNKIKKFKYLPESDKEEQLRNFIQQIKKYKNGRMFRGSSDDKVKILLDEKIGEKKTHELFQKFENIQFKEKIDNLKKGGAQCWNITENIQNLKRFGKTEFVSKEQISKYMNKVIKEESLNVGNILNIDHIQYKSDEQLKFEKQQKLLEQKGRDIDEIMLQEFAKQDQENQKSIIEIFKKTKLESKQNELTSVKLKQKHEEQELLFKKQWDAEKKQYQNVCKAIPRDKSKFIRNKKQSNFEEKYKKKNAKKTNKLYLKEQKEIDRIKKQKNLPKNVNSQPYFDQYILEKEFQRKKALQAFQLTTKQPINIDQQKEIDIFQQIEQNFQNLSDEQFSNSERSLESSDNEGEQGNTEDQEEKSSNQSVAKNTSIVMEENSEENINKSILLQVSLDKNQQKKNQKHDNEIQQQKQNDNIYKLVIQDATPQNFNNKKVKFFKQNNKSIQEKIQKQDYNFESVCQIQETECINNNDINYNNINKIKEKQQNQQKQYYLPKKKLSSHNNILMSSNNYLSSNQSTQNNLDNTSMYNQMGLNNQNQNKTPSTNRFKSFSYLQSPTLSLKNSDSQNISKNELQKKLQLLNNNSNNKYFSPRLSVNQIKNFNQNQKIKSKSISINDFDVKNDKNEINCNLNNKNNDQQKQNDMLQSKRSSLNKSLKSSSNKNNFLSQSNISNASKSQNIQKIDENKRDSLYLGKSNDKLQVQNENQNMLNSQRLSVNTYISPRVSIKPSPRLSMNQSFNKSLMNSSISKMGNSMNQSKSKGKVNKDGIIKSNIKIIMNNENKNNVKDSQKSFPKFNFKKNWSLHSNNIDNKNKEAHGNLKSLNNDINSKENSILGKNLIKKNKSQADIDMYKQKEMQKLENEKILNEKINFFSDYKIKELQLLGFSQQKIQSMQKDKFQKQNDQLFLKFQQFIESCVEVEEYDKKINPKFNKGLEFLNERLNQDLQHTDIEYIQSKLQLKGQFLQFKKEKYFKRKLIYFLIDKCQSSNQILSQLSNKINRKQILDDYSIKLQEQYDLLNLELKNQHFIQQQQTQNQIKEIQNN